MKNLFLLWLLFVTSLSSGQFNSFIGLTPNDVGDSQLWTDIQGDDPNSDCVEGSQCNCTDTATQSLTLNGGNALVQRLAPVAAMAQMVTASDGTTLARDSSQNIYTRVRFPEGWSQVAGTGGSHIAVGSSSYIYKISGTTGTNVYQLNTANNTWVQLSSGNVSRMSAASDGSIAGLNAGRVYRWTPTGLGTGTWNPLPVVPNGGAIDVAATTSGWTFALDTQGNFWGSENYAAWISFSPSPGTGFSRMAISDNFTVYLTKANDAHITSYVPYSFKAPVVMALPVGTNVAELSSPSMMSVFITTAAGTLQQFLPNTTKTLTIAQKSNTTFNTTLTSLLVNADPGQTLSFGATTTIKNSCTGVVDSWNWAPYVRPAFTKAKWGGTQTNHYDIYGRFDGYTCNAMNWCTAATGGSGPNVSADPPLCSISPMPPGNVLLHPNAGLGCSQSFFDTSWEAYRFSKAANFQCLTWPLLWNATAAPDGSAFGNCTGPASYFNIH
jgi:hypothetical protein